MMRARASARIDGLAPASTSVPSGPAAHSISRTHRKVDSQGPFCRAPGSRIGECRSVAGRSRPGRCCPGRCCPALLGRCRRRCSCFLRSARRAEQGKGQYCHDDHDYDADGHITVLHGYLPGPTPGAAHRTRPATEARHLVCSRHDIQRASRQVEYAIAPLRLSVADGRNAELRRAMKAGLVGEEGFAGDASH